MTIEININDQFEKWTVIGPAIPGEGGKPRRHPCRCECGTIRNVISKKLVTGQSTSCGCDRKAKIAAAMQQKKETPVKEGQRFGHLKAISAVAGTSPLRWLCECDCDGKRIEVEERKLQMLLTTSCGCTSGGRRDLSGKQFGHLHVLNDFRSAGDTHIEWLTECKLCGKRKWIRGSRMVSGLALSCGCTTGLNFTKNRIKKKEGDEDNG